MYSKRVASYPRNAEGEAKALAFLQGWVQAFNMYSEQYALENIVVEFPQGSPNVHVVVYRGYYNEEGEVWPDGRGE